EIAMARHIMQEMRLTTTQKKKAKQFFNLGKTLYNPQTQLMLFYQTCRYNSALVKLFLDIQYRFAQVDTLTPSKINLLNHLFRQMGYAPIYEQQRYQRDNTRQSYQESAYQQHTTSPNTSPSLTDACRILNITPEASMREIKQAYRRLISQHHPDKLVARKAPQHEIKAANEKTQQITKAYDKICQYKLGK
ncbi:MAG TPA: co-chaperone DjlA, partial [Legionellales bacterium]|nr:co-chaperone DjlA [Legionellales bacterium]